MKIPTLETYLRMHRLRCGLTHDEVAFLCGGMSGAGVSRHEHGTRLPTLRTALMYEFILGATVRDLFEGVFDGVRLAVQARARGLLFNAERKPPSLKREHKVAVLRALLNQIAEMDRRTP